MIEPSPPHDREVRDMPTISIEISDLALSALQLRPNEAAHEVRMAAAVKLFELGRLSSGAAAELAGIPRVAFLTKLREYGVSAFSDTDDELGEGVSRD